MRPTLQLTALLLVSASLMACSGRAAAILPPEENTVKPTAVTPQNATFSVARGATVTVGLKSAGGGGYEWHLVEGFDSRVVRLKGQRRGEVPPGNLVGAFADEIYDFEATGAGQTTLVFAQYRDWEGPTRAVETLRYPVTVK
jgi:hypothetical protein